MRAYVKKNQHRTQPVDASVYKQGFTPITAGTTHTAATLLNDVAPSKNNAKYSRSRLLSARVMSLSSSETSAPPKILPLFLSLTHIPAFWGQM